MEIADKKAVVTGGAGFIGSHLAESLVNRGYSVIVVDDLSSGSLSHLESFLKKPDARFIRGSVTDLSLLQELFQGAHYIFHLAAIPGVAFSINSPLNSHAVNLTGTLNVLLAARDNGVNKVVYASSAAVYGDSPVLPLSENMLPDPLSPYAVTKLAGEYYCRVFQQIYALPAVCLRYFNVYGPRQDPRSDYAAVIPSFIQRVSKGEAPLIYGDGEQSRDFVFVEDAAEANILVAESGASGVFNIASGQSISINRLAEVLISASGSHCRPVHGEARPGDIRHSRADISKAMTIGYRPRHHLEAELNKMVRSRIGSL